MEIKLNNSELNLIITAMDDMISAYTDEPMVLETICSILNKINDNVRDPTNRCVEEWNLNVIKFLNEHME